MKNKFSRSEYDTINKLVNMAITSASKKEAQPYIQRLEFMKNSVVGYSAAVYSELVSSVKAASGRVADKTRLVDNATWCLNKFELFCVEDY